MVALGVLPAQDGDIVDDHHGTPLRLLLHGKLSDQNVSDDVAQEPSLSTKTDASSVVVSMSSADESEDEDECRCSDQQQRDGSDESEDADDEGSDDDVLCIMPSDLPCSNAAQDDATANEKPVSQVHTSGDELDVLPVPEKKDTAAAPSNLFSLISIPRRVRESVFPRKSQLSEAVPVSQPPHSSDEPEVSVENKPCTISPERESSVDTASPSSNYASLTLQSLTSFSFSQRTPTNDERQLQQHEQHQLQLAVTSENVETFKTFWDEKLRATMDRLAHVASADTGAAVFERQRDPRLDVFHLLLKLYAHQDVIEELYASYESNAPEFEFYIPQLCTFLIHGNYAKQHALECFLMSRSGESLVFAHRLFWFLKSFCGDARGYTSEYLSVTSSPEDENADLLVAIRQRGGVPAVLMEQGLNMEEVDKPGPNLLLRRASSFDIDAAAEATSAMARQSVQVSNQQDHDHDNDDDEAFAAFLRRKRDVLLYEAMPEEGNDQQVALYNATPDFVAELTDLADRLIPLPLAQRNEELRRGLANVCETSLPSNVIYLPVGNSYHRVKGILIDECFTFSTKERVPYFMCVEVIDYSVRVSDEDAKKPRKPLLGRRQNRKFGLKLRFKKNREPFVDKTKSKSKSKSRRRSGSDGVYGKDVHGLPLELLYEEESKANEDADDLSAYQSAFQYDMMDPNVLALTPHGAPTEAELAARFDSDEETNQDAAGDEKETCEESTDAEQKKRMGQWGLSSSRTRRRDQVVRPNAPKTSSKFDSFYSSWFASRKQKPLENSLLSPSPTDPSLSECVMVTPSLLPPSNGNQDHEPVVARESKPDPCESMAEPVPEPKANTASHSLVDSSDDEMPRRRGRDMSVSLDFTDGDAWKLNFGLEDVLTDAEPEVTADVDTPELTPEVHTDQNDPSSENVDHDGTKTEENDADEEEEDEEDDEEEEDEKPIIVFRERWAEKEERIRKDSPHGSHPGWRLLPVIVKSNDDLRQEQFAAQLIAQCDRIFKGYSLPLRLRPYNVIATSAKTGLIEAVPDTVSLDSLKRNDPNCTTLLAFYERLFGSDTTEFRQARRNFVESLAAYSILCYVFQIKDRHNGNILLDTDGHVIHIDFGFLLTNSPGSNLNFERAPFKLTDEFVELMGGPRSAAFRYFRSLCIRAYLALRRNMDKIVLLVEMMLVGNADLPCFAGGKRAVIEGLKERLKPGARTSECQLFVNQLIDRSINNWRTRWYDKYQRAWVGIL